jgi:uncharacterized protein
MGLVRLIIFALVIWLAWRLVKATLMQKRGEQGRQRSSEQDNRVQKMVRCHQCGVHVPENEAFSHQSLHFCSQEHQRVYLEQHHDD